MDNSPSPAKRLKDHPEDIGSVLELGRAYLLQWSTRPIHPALLRGAQDGA